MAAIQLQPPQYPPFDCKTEGKGVRWAKWLRRLEQNVFLGCHIDDPAQKKGLLLMYAGDDLNDIVDAFDPATLEATLMLPYLSTLPTLSPLSCSYSHATSTLCGP